MNAELVYLGASQCRMRNAECRMRNAECGTCLSRRKAMRNKNRNQLQKFIIDQIDSTNSYAKTLDYDDDSIIVIRAIRQTGGRGRGDNVFFSDHAGGLWVSIVTPIDDISQHFNHNRAISLAILESLKKGFDSPLKIKWPNDIYCGEKKIAGILLENVPGVTNRLIIGFGLNVNIPAKDFPQNLRGIVTSVLAETDRETPLDCLLDDIVDGYLRYHDSDTAAAHKLYCDNLYGVGRRVSVYDRNETKASGTLTGVEPDGRLILDTDHGTESITSGTLQYM